MKKLGRLDQVGDNTVRKRVYQKSVRIEDLQDGIFVRRSGESLGSHAMRVGMCGCDYENSVKKVVRYSKAMTRGDIFPPLFLIEIDGDLAIHDGNHRVGAAALCGLETIKAIVIKAETVSEENAISEAFFSLDFNVDRTEDKPDWRNVEYIELGKDPKAIVRAVN